MRADKKELDYLLDKNHIEYFSVDELIQTDHPDWNGKNEYMPPACKLTNIIPTLVFADWLREEWGGPIEVNSGYRPELYNDFIGGAENSQHVKFRALDLVPQNGEIKRFQDFVQEKLDAYIKQTQEPTGLGLYDWGVHIDFCADLPGHNKHRRWDNREYTDAEPE